MLKLEVYLYNSFNDCKENRKEFVIDTTEEAICDILERKFGNKLDFQYWKSLRTLSIKKERYTDIVIRVGKVRVITKEKFENML